MKEFEHYSWEEIYELLRCTIPCCQNPLNLRKLVKDDEKEENA